MIEMIDKDERFKINVGEQLLYYIDSCRDHESSEKLGILFKAFLEEIISYDDFMRASNVIEKISNEIFNDFLEMKGEVLLIDAGSFLSEGLVYVDYSTIKINFFRGPYIGDLRGAKSSINSAENAEIDPLSGSVEVSEVGRIILKVFKDDK